MSGDPCESISTGETAPGQARLGLRRKRHNIPSSYGNAGGTGTVGEGIATQCLLLSIETSSLCLGSHRDSVL
jgi:hypothetical protein